MPRSKYGRTPPNKHGGVGRQQHVVPIAVREVSLEPGVWVENYTKEELRKVQLDNEIVGEVLRWLELGVEPQREELLLVDPAVKYFGGSRRIGLLEVWYLNTSGCPE